ncbi:MAG: peptidylprolyl isomerase, partial [Planctomycetota bacterium]|nr:peptidylprolyl isomerase [Planctomycetota bacterium]
GEVVLASEVISLFVRDFIEKIDKPITREQRKELIRARLQYHTELKLIYIDAKRSIPEEAMPKVKESIAKHFEDKEITSMMKAAKVDSRQGLDDKLRTLGTSIERQKHIFIERALAMQWMQQQATAGKTITHEMLLEYYNEHLSDYEHEARSRWEELAVKVSAQSGRAEAFARIARMGNLVQDGSPFPQVAKNGSDGITAHKGGARDWTTKGSLVSEEIDKAIFNMPVGAMSRIIESKRGFHIVRVTEREDAHRTPFFEVQSKIRKTIKNQQEMQGRKEYLAKLASQTKVWTIFDKPGSEQLQADLRGVSGGRGR